MKKILASCFLLLAIHSVIAQTSTQKFITVTGTAEMEVVPDEIYFRVTLREFIKDKNKVLIDSLEKELSKAVAASGVPKENFMIEQVYGERWRRKKTKIAELYSSKVYIIKVSEPSKMDDILDKVNAESIESVEIKNFSHSKIQEYKKQLKIEAIKVAKTKAGYLLDAIGEQLGGALEVTENDASYTPYYHVAQYSNSRLGSVERASYSDSDYADQSIGFQKIKLKFQVTVKFAIK